MGGDNFNKIDLDALKAVLQSLNKITFKELEGSEVIAVSSAFNHLYKLQGKIINYLKDKEEVVEKKVVKSGKGNAKKKSKKIKR